MWLLRVRWEHIESAPHVSGMYRKNVWRHVKTGEERTTTTMTW